MGADVQGLIADPQFQGLSPADKRSALYGVTRDADFQNLSDADTMQFVSNMQARGQISRPDLYKPPGVQKPQINMQQSMLAPTDHSDPTVLPFGAGMHGGSYDIFPRDDKGIIVPGNSPQMKAAAIGGTIGAAASPFVIPAALNVAKSVPSTLKAMGTGAVVEEVVRRGAKAFGVPVPDWVPAFAGMLAAGGGGKGAAEKEVASASASEAASEAEATGSRVPSGNFAKETPNPDAYNFKGAPKSMDIVQSTNVGKMGYEPNSRTMTVEYKNGLVYSYHGVPPEVYQGAQESESTGSYISRNIKGRYETVRRGSVLVKKQR